MICTQSRHLRSCLVQTCMGYSVPSCQVSTSVLACCLLACLHRLLTRLTALAFGGWLILLDLDGGRCVKCTSAPVYSVSSQASTLLDIAEPTATKLRMLTCDSATERQALACQLASRQLQLGWTLTADCYFNSLKHSCQLVGRLWREHLRCDSCEPVFKPHAVHALQSDAAVVMNRFSQTSTRSLRLLLQDTGHSCACNMHHQPSADL